MTPARRSKLVKEMSFAIGMCASYKPEAFAEAAMRALEEQQAFEKPPEEVEPL